MRDLELHERNAATILEIDAENSDGNRRERWLRHQQGRCGHIPKVLGRDQVRELALRQRTGHCPRPI